MAERAGLENRRWGNSSASSNLAPSAIFSRVIFVFSAGTVAKLWLKSSFVACLLAAWKSLSAASVFNPPARSASQTMA